MDVQERNVINFSSSIFLVVVLDAPRDDDDQADMFELALPADFMLHYRRPAAYLVVVVVHQQIKVIGGQRCPAGAAVETPNKAVLSCLAVKQNKSTSTFVLSNHFNKSEKSVNI
jgi:hypothetical protein